MPNQSYLVVMPYQLPCLYRIGSRFWGDEDLKGMDRLDIVTKVK